MLQDCLCASDEAKKLLNQGLLHDDVLLCWSRQCSMDGCRRKSKCQYRSENFGTIATKYLCKVVCCFAVNKSFYHVACTQTW